MSTLRTDFSATPNETEQEARNIRRLQLMISMVMSVISQDENLTVEEASELAAGAKRAALAMFPDKELRPPRPGIGPRRSKEVAGAHREMLLDRAKRQSGEVNNTSGIDL